MKQIAEKWGIAPTRVAIMIREGRIAGAYKIGAAWVMPADTQKPMDMRINNGKHPRKKKAAGEGA